jgi:serine/threonine protein kinase
MPTTLPNSLNTLSKTVMSTNRLELCAPIVLGEEWSRGTFGSVYVVDTPTGRIAVKRVPDTIGHTNRELETCVKLASENHPNIVKLLGYWTENTSPATLYLVMEFLPETLGSVLARYVVNKMRIKMRRMTALMGQLASALDHLEQIHLMHRDLKPENLLVNMQTNRLALADFGSAKFVEPGKSNVTYICTRFYRAPELILDRCLYSTSVDIWAFGCILGEFSSGRPLFTGETQVDVLASIMRTRGMMTMDDIKHMPTHRSGKIDTTDVGTGCEPTPWSNVFTRLILDKHVITSYGECYEQVLDDCLQWNPSRRISAFNLSRHALFNSTLPTG